MDNHDKQAFHWVVKQGNIMLLADNDKIHLEINKENNPTCLLTKSDAEEVIFILTNISRNIWDNPNYTKEPYTGKLYTLDDNGKAYWDINDTRLLVGLNDQQDALEMNFQGNPVMKVSVNFSIEIIQIMTHFSNKL
jgi:hypothetical protein